MKRLVGLILCLITLVGCLDWCGGVPKDFEKGTAVSLNENYEFPYIKYSTCRIQSVGMDSIKGVDLIKKLDYIQDDTLHDEICEGGDYRYKTQSHVLAFSNDSSSIRLMVKYTKERHGGGEISMEVKGLPNFPDLYFSEIQAYSSRDRKNWRYRLSEEDSTGKMLIEHSDSTEKYILQFKK